MASPKGTASHNHVEFVARYSSSSNPRTGSAEPRYPAPSSLYGSSQKHQLNKHHLTDHGAVHAGTGFRHQGQTTLSQAPPSPAPRKALIGPHRSLVYEPEESPTGGISVYPSGSPSPSNRLHGPTTSLKAPPPSPCLSALSNRRSTYASTLLGSTARPGYSRGMKHIFDEARHDNRPPVDELGGYPMLRNDAPLLKYHGYRPAPGISQVSRVSEHGTSHRSLMTASHGHDKPRSILKKQNTLLPALDSVALESGSWSGDSDYLTAEPPARRKSPAGLSPEPRIKDWLESVPIYPHARHNFLSSTESPSARNRSHRLHARPAISPLSRTPLAKSLSSIDGTETSSAEEICLRTDQQRRRRRQFSVPLPPARSPTLTTRSASRARGSKGSRTPASGNRASNDSKPTKKPSTPTPPGETSSEGGVKIAPLSPNVCIERGHSRRGRRVNATTTDTIRGLGLGSKAPPLARYARNPSSRRSKDEGRKPAGIKALRGGVELGGSMK